MDHETVNRDSIKRDTSLNVSSTLGVDTNEVVNEKGKYYYLADPVKHYYIQNPDEVDSLYAKKETKPTLDDLMRTCLQEGYSISVEAEKSQLIFSEAEQKYEPNLFHKGDWIEHLGSNMAWDLEQITLVVLQRPDGWDYLANNGEDPPLEDMNVYYNIGAKGLVPQSEVRAPEQGLRHIFGGRPFLWQQHCLLQLERRLRFQKDHEYDFAEVAVQWFAETRFEEWLHARGNEDFAEHFFSMPVLTQKLLRMHLASPFRLMDEITEDKTKWNFKDRDFTVYTYYGIFGSGCPTVFFTVLIQVLAIFVLLVYSTREYNGEPNERFFIGEDGTVEGVYVFGLVPETNFTTFCNNEGSIDGKILISVVMLMYFIRIVPNSLQQFYKVSGTANTTYSKVNSLRQVIWNKNDDTFPQQVGFKLDRIMNVGFTCFLYCSMLFLLFNTPIVIDIIINALAVEFIHQFDESVANAEWWDPGRRYLMAGCQELVLRAYLKLHVLRDPYLICKEFGIDVEKYKEAIGSMGKALHDPHLGSRDDCNPTYMSKNERLWQLFADHARGTGNHRALLHFEEVPSSYGLFDRLAPRGFLNNNAIFSRFKSYRVWSRWEALLYLPSIPKQDMGHIHGVEDVKTSFCAPSQGTYLSDFALHVFRVLFLIQAVESLLEVATPERFLQIPWRFITALLEFLSYWIQVLFPFYVLTGLALVPFCY